MDENIRLLTEISRNCEAGAESIRLLLCRVPDAAMRDELLFQRKNYMDMGREAADLLAQAGRAISALSDMDRWSLRAGVKMNTLRDKSPARAADLILQGSVMGLIELIRARKKCPAASEEAKALSERLLTFLRDSSQRMEQFL